MGGVTDEISSVLEVTPKRRYLAVIRLLLGIRVMVLPVTITTPATL